MFQKSKMYKNIGSFFFQHNLLSFKSLKGKKKFKNQIKLKLKINRHTMDSDGQIFKYKHCKYGNAMFLEAYILGISCKNVKPTIVFYLKQVLPVDYEA